MPLILDTNEIRSLGRRTRSKRIGPIRPPVKAERFMRRRVEAIWQTSVFPAVQRIKQAVETGMSADYLADLMERELRTAEYEWGTQGPDIIDMWRLLVDRETRIAMNSALSKSLGIDISAIYDDPIVADAMSMGSMDAANLIVTIPQQYLGKVQQAVMDNMLGVPLPDGRSLLEQIDFISGRENFKKHAKLIARDQTAKMTSLLNQTRQQMIGVDMYIWRTSRDQRVVGNPSGLYPVGNSKHGNHWMMEGLTCRWDDATVYSTDGGKTWKKRTGEMPKDHPGMQIQCRCYAEPVIDIQRIIEYARAA